MKEELTISGMSCQHCVRAVEQALGAIESVEVNRVDIGSAEVSYDPSLVTRAQFVEALDEEGFELVSADA